METTKTEEREYEKRETFQRKMEEIGDSLFCNVGLHSIATGGQSAGPWESLPKLFSAKRTEMASIVFKWVCYEPCRACGNLCEACCKGLAECCQCCCDGCAFAFELFEKSFSFCLLMSIGLNVAAGAYAIAAVAVQPPPHLY